MPDPLLDDVLANEVGQNVFEWTIQCAAESPRVVQIANCVAALSAIVIAGVGCLLYPGAAAIGCFVASSILLLSIMLTLFIVAVIRGS
jgi:hypothetical protein